MGAPINIVDFDHLVLKVSDIEATLEFYVDRLGLEPLRVDERRSGTAPFPSARISPGAILDFFPVDEAVNERNVDHFCLVADRASIDAICEPDSGITVRSGPGERFGARGQGWSVYVTDPDGYVIEIRSYD